jgi:hypothetical protein
MSSRVHEDCRDCLPCHMASEVGFLNDPSTRIESCDGQTTRHEVPKGYMLSERLSQVLGSSYSQAKIGGEVNVQNLCQLEVKKA